MILPSERAVGSAARAGTAVLGADGAGVHLEGVPTISVLVPSWRRPDALERCLRALAAQSVAPLEIVVGLRDDDTESVRRIDGLRDSLGVTLRSVTTRAPGVVASMNTALAACGGDIVALTDDDTEPHRDWLARIDRAFDDPRVGGVGGRDWQPNERTDRTDVERVQWFGRTIGNHHLGAGPARSVDILKGANAAFRRRLLTPIGFDTRLTGGGAQMFWELAVCLPIRRAGWLLIYDPAIAVDHHVAVRHDDDQRHRGFFAAGPQRDAVHNETLVLLEHQRGFARVAFLLWAFLVGTRIEPGLAQLPRLITAGDAHAVARWRATFDGRRLGLSAWRRSGRDRAADLPTPPA
jgi:cellulose synthase/poly-beta-1,6-N-acetylglucosamine synthase-like glycosyltransferase